MSEFDYYYDSVYNRTSWDIDGSTIYSYQDNALNQYTQINTTTPTYDSRGNCTSYGFGGTLSYDEENRLVSAGSVSYTYDLLGRRLSRTYNSSTTTYVWDGAHIIAEYTDGSLTKKYIYGPGIDNPVAMVNVSGTTETWYYYYTDNLGSVRLLSDASGSIVESYTYLVYGWPYVMYAAGNDGNWLTEDVSTYNSSASGIDNTYMFTGRRWDSVAYVYYYRFRDYAPVIGRFLQTDPAKYIDTMNLYAYCGNNPVNWTDSWGLCPKIGDEKVDNIDNKVLPPRMEPWDEDLIDDLEKNGTPFTPPSLGPTLPTELALGHGYDKSVKNAAGAVGKIHYMSKGRRAWRQYQKYKYGRKWYAPWKKGWKKDGKPYWKEIKGGPGWNGLYYRDEDAAWDAIMADEYGEDWLTNPQL